MKFFHVYNEDYFEGLVKNGLINEDSAFKLQHVFSLEADKKFNRFAAKGSELYSFIRENRFPFYVDRIAGGVTYHHYDFDKDLIDEYRELLDGWFLGFQQHETGGNRFYDWNNVRKMMNGEPGPYDAEELKRKSVLDYAKTPEGETLYGFVQGTPEEYAAKRAPATVTEALADLKDLFERRMSEVNGLVLPCDSNHLLTHMQNRLGMRAFMPEVGCQIPHMRVAVALARGMAKAYQKKWGVYYECWRTVQPYIGPTMPCFNDDPGNEWNLTQEAHRDDFTTYGPFGGSSRYLQKRIYFYSLMAGARFLSEEWGLNCSYLEMNGDFPLSPYGEAKKEFIEFSRSHRDVKAIVPFAVVLPAEHPLLRLQELEKPIGKRKNTAFGLDLSEGEIDLMGRVDDVLKLIFSRDPDSIRGNEGHVLQNSRFGDLFDIIYEDAPKAALSGYELLIDTTAGGRIAKDNPALPVVTFNGKNFDDLARLINEKSREILPVRADRFLWLISEDENGKYLSVFNNEGNDRNVEWGDRVISEADGTATIGTKEGVELSVLWASHERTSLSRLDDLNYSLFLPAASFAVICLGNNNH